MPGSLFVQFLSKSSLVYLLVWHHPLHTPYISSPNHCLLFTAYAHTITTCFAVVLRLYHLFVVFLNSLLETLVFYLNATHPSDHSHLCLLKCHLIFFSYRPSFTSMQHTTSHTTAVQSASHYQWYILIANCKNLFHPIRILASTAASASPSTLSISTTKHCSVNRYHAMLLQQWFVVDWG